MLVKLYGLLWLITAVSMTVLFMTGTMNLLALIVFGFILFALLYGGIISVLPEWVTHSPSGKK